MRVVETLCVSTSLNVQSAFNILRNLVISPIGLYPIEQISMPERSILLKYLHARIWFQNRKFSTLSHPGFVTMLDLSDDLTLYKRTRRHEAAQIKPRSKISVSLEELKTCDVILIGSSARISFSSTYILLRQQPWLKCIQGIIDWLNASCSI